MIEKYVELLYRSFDDSLSPREEEELENALEIYESLRREKEKISDMRRALAESGKQKFPSFFVERVMSRINSWETKEEIWYESIMGVFRPIAVAAIMLLIILLTYNFNTNKKISFNSAMNTPSVTVEDAFDPFTFLSLEN
jgi:hypothetical protein